MHDAFVVIVDSGNLGLHWPIMWKRFKCLVGTEYWISATKR